MKLRVVDRQALDEAGWNRLARAGSFFHTTTWTDVCTEGLAAARPGTSAEAVFLCGYENDYLVAGMPGIVTGRFGFKAFDSMPSATYGGMLLGEGLTEPAKREFLEEVAAYFRRRRYSRITITDFNGALSGWEGLKTQRIPCFTHIIALDSLNDFDPHRRVQRDLRAGQKLESSVERIESAQEIDAFYRLYHLTERRHGRKRPQFRRGFFHALFRIMAGSQQLYWVGLMAGGEMIASQLNFIHHDMLINWRVVSDYEKRRYRPNQLLLYDAVKQAAASGVTRINLGASPADAHGLIEYKERWGGDRVEYDILVYRSWFRKLVGR